MSRACLETCPTCMGSGYSNHPDSGEVCQNCMGSGGPKPRVRIKAPSVRITWTQYALNYMDPRPSPSVSRQLTLEQMAQASDEARRAAERVIADARINPAAKRVPMGPVVSRPNQNSEAK